MLHLPDEIWLEIMQFATYLHEHHSITPLDPFNPRRISYNAMAVNTLALSSRTKASLVLVCRSWRRIANQILYSHLPVRSPRRARSILVALVHSSEGPPEQRLYYGQWTRHIEIYTHARHAGGIEYLKTIHSILQLCPNLRILSGNWHHRLPPAFLEAISRKFGPTLQGLYWNDANLPRHKSHLFLPFLASFSALRVLDLRGCQNLRSGATGSNLETNITPILLSQVQTLVLSNTRPSLSLATSLVLPALHNLTLTTHGNEPCQAMTSFLQIHGTLLSDVTLFSQSCGSELGVDDSFSSFPPDIFLKSNICPNLLTLTFPASSPCIDPDTRHFLRRIGLLGVCADNFSPCKETSVKAHLMSFTPERFPELEIVKIIDLLVDASLDGLIENAIWWAERFGKHDVDFLDGEGVLWTYTD